MILAKNKKDFEKNKEEGKKISFMFLIQNLIHIFLCFLKRFSFIEKTCWDFSFFFISYKRKTCWKISFFYFLKYCFSSAIFSFFFFNFY